MIWNFQDENSSSLINITKSYNTKTTKLDFDSIYTIIEIFLYIIDTKKRNDAIIQITHKV